MTRVIGTTSGSTTGLTGSTGIGTTSTTVGFGGLRVASVDSGCLTVLLGLVERFWSGVAEGVLVSDVVVMKVVAAVDMILEGSSVMGSGIIGVGSAGSTASVEVRVSEALVVEIAVSEVWLALGESTVGGTKGVDEVVVLASVVAGSVGVVVVSSVVMGSGGVVVVSSVVTVSIKEVVVSLVVTGAVVESTGREVVSALVESEALVDVGTTVTGRLEDDDRGCEVVVGTVGASSELDEAGRGTTGVSTVVAVDSEVKLVIGG